MTGRDAGGLSVAQQLLRSRRQLPARQICKSDKRTQRRRTSSVQIVRNEDKQGSRIRVVKPETV